MKKYIFILLISFISTVALCQDQLIENRDFVAGNISYPFSKCNASVIKDWEGIADVNFVYNKYVYRNLCAGFTLDYSLMNFTAQNPDKEVRDKLRRMILKPGIFVGYRRVLFERFLVNASLNFGYSFINYKYRDNKDYWIGSNSGYNIYSGIQIYYYVNPVLLVGLSSSYNIIFKPVGTPSYTIPAIYTTSQDQRIKTLNTGLSIGYLF